MPPITAAEYKLRLKLYEKLIATIPAAARKGATMPYTSHNGNMFSVLNKDGSVGLRLPADEGEAFIRKYKSKHQEQYGVVQKEYVVVPDALLAKTAELKKYFAMSWTYVQSLKPKATTRKK